MELESLIAAMRLTSRHSLRILAKLPGHPTDADVLKAAREIVADENKPAEQSDEKRAMFWFRTNYPNIFAEVSEQMARGK